MPEYSSVRSAGFSIVNRCSFTLSSLHESRAFMAESLDESFRFAGNWIIRLMSDCSTVSCSPGADISYLPNVKYKNVSLVQKLIFHRCKVSLDVDR